MEIPITSKSIHYASLSKHSLRRQDTPSTICDDQDVELQANGRRSTPSFKARSFRDLSSGSSKGLTENEFKTYIREPFRFPAVSVKTNAATPVCIICRGQLQAGQLCRELKGCGHCFHASCVELHFGSHSRCPVCRFKCKAKKEINGKTRGSQARIRQRPCWTPEYDSELLILSDKLDRERRQKNFLLKGKRDSVPQSYIFLKSTLPTVLEESQEALQCDDGTLLFLCRHVYREREMRKLQDLSAWTEDMKRLGITFMYSVSCMYFEQLMWVDLLIKRDKFMRRHAFSNRDH